jgi:Ion channel
VSATGPKVSKLHRKVTDPGGRSPLPKPPDYAEKMGLSTVQKPAGTQENQTRFPDTFRSPFGSRTTPPAVTSGSRPKVAAPEVCDVWETPTVHERPSRPKHVQDLGRSNVGPTFAEPLMLASGGRLPGIVRGMATPRSARALVRWLLGDPIRRRTTVAWMMFAATGALFLMHFKTAPIPFAPWSSTICIVVAGRSLFYFVAHGARGDIRFATGIWMLILMQMLVFFAMLYRSFGLLHSGVTTAEPGECLYFSIITWTTVGYGDYVPATGDGRTAAAAEALLGYIFMALTLAIIASRLHEWPLGKQRTTRPRT